MGHKILLTGGAGYIGSHTYVALQEAGFDVVILDDFSNSKPSVLVRLGQITGNNRVEFYEGSVLDRDLLARVFKEHNFDAVVHFAARKAVGESVEKPLDYLNTNVSGLLALLQEMKAAGVMRMVFSSSATVYGEAKIVPTPETAERQYTNPYGFTKMVGEMILEQAADADPWAFGILRYFNPVGAHPSGMIGEDPSDIPNNLMPYIAKVATGELPHLNVFGDDYDTRDGTGDRDYIHVSDLAQGHVLSLQSLIETNQGHTVNLGTGSAISVLEMKEAYAKACGKDLAHKVQPRRAGDVPISQANATRARELLGFETKYGLDEMCTSSWHWIETGSKT